MHNKHRVAKLFLAILVVLDLLLLMAAFSPFYINKRGFNRAFNEWYANPSPKTEAILKHEKSLLRRDVVIMYSIITGLFCLNTMAIIMIWKHITGRKLSLSRNQPR
jgi:hypothetical protein